MSDVEEVKIGVSKEDMVVAGLEQVVDAPVADILKWMKDDFVRETERAKLGCLLIIVGLLGHAMGKSEWDLLWVGGFWLVFGLGVLILKVWNKMGYLDGFNKALNGIFKKE